jgi:hypothetical protein
MLTRRAALKGGTAIVAAIAVTGAVAARVAVDQDAHLQSLAGQHNLIYSQWARSWDEEDRATDAYHAARPERPVELIGRLRGSDGDDRPFFLDREQLDRWKAAHLSMWGGTKHEPKILNRHQESIAALETYEAECETVRRACGLAGAELRNKELCHKLYAIKDEALATRTLSFDGIKAKLRATINPDEVADWEREEKDGVLESNEMVLLSLWRDAHQAEG